MADIKIDSNYKGVSAGITDDSNQTIQPLRVNPVTNRLLTDTSISSVTISGGTINTIAGGTININSMPAVSVSTGSPVSVDWVYGFPQAGGSISVNMVAGSISSVGVSTISNGTITKLSTGSVQLIYPSTVLISGGTTVSGGTTIAQVDVNGNLMVSLGTKLDSTNDSVTALIPAGSGTVGVSGGSIQTIAGSVTNAIQSGLWGISTVSTGTINNILNVANGTIQASQLGLWGISTISNGTINIATISNGTVKSTQLGDWKVDVSSVGTISSGTIKAVNYGTVTDSLSSKGTAVTGATSPMTIGVDGVQIVRPYSGLEDIIVASTGTAAAGTTQLFAGVASTKLYITDITAISSSGGSILSTITLYDNATARYQIPVPPAGGATLHFTTPLSQTSWGSPWIWKTDLSYGSIWISAIGFKSKV